MIDGCELECRCVEARAVRRADVWRHVDGLCDAIGELWAERRALVGLVVAWLGDDPFPVSEPPVVSDGSFFTLFKPN